MRVSASALAIAAIAGAAGSAAADGPAIYIAEVESYSGGEVDAIAGEVRRAVESAGYATAPARADAACPASDRACLARRAEDAGAAAALRAAHVRLADEEAVAIHVVGAAGGRAASEVVARGDLASANGALAAALATVVAGPDGRAGGPDGVTWTLAGTSAALAVGGGTALAWAHWRRHHFLRNHVDDSGNVVGLSPEDARSADRRARVVSWLGGALLAGAAVTGVSAGFYYARSDSGAETGLSLRGRF